MARKTLVWSYGGGTQSVAIAILIAQGKLPKPDLIVMADTGREMAATFAYLTDYVQPLLAEHGLRVEIAGHELSKVDLYSTKGKLLIPAFTAKGKLPTFCSVEWKQRVIRRWLRARGVRQCVTWIGMSVNEIERLKPSGVKWQEYHWPLAWDLRMTRNDCVELIKAQGWPPVRSRCAECPNQSDEEWLEVKTTSPKEFKRACALDESIRMRDRTHSVYLHNSRKPLAMVDFTLAAGKPSLFDGCDSGFCFV